MTATTTPAVGTEVTERLDRMASQLDLLTAELQRQREQREMWQELTHDLAPIARDVMSSMTAELDGLKDTVSTEELLRLVRQLAVSLPTIEAALGQLVSLGELAGDATTLAGPAMASLTERLATLEERGYLGFARSSLGVVDRVMTSFSEDDVEALGENVVLILETVKEMTQPEIMTMLRRTAHLVNEPEAAPSEPPSLFALLKEMRDPEVRRGLARMLALLRSLSDTPEN